MSSEKLCCLMRLQLEAFSVQNLNFARKLLPVAWRFKSRYTFLGKWAVLVSAKLIILGFDWILALETTTPSIRGAASPKTCCDKQQSEHCGALWSYMHGTFVNAGGFLGYHPQTRGFCVFLHVLPLGGQENVFFFLFPIQILSHAFYIV